MQFIFFYRLYYSVTLHTITKKKQKTKTKQFSPHVGSSQMSTLNLLVSLNKSLFFLVSAMFYLFVYLFIYFYSNCFFLLYPFFFSLISSAHLLHIGFTVSLPQFRSAQSLMAIIGVFILTSEDTLSAKWLWMRSSF